MNEGVQSSTVESNQGPIATSLTPVEETQETSPQQIGTMPSSEAPNEVSQADTEAEKPSSPNKRGLTSQAWTHFKRQKIEDKWKAICKYCNKLGGDTRHDMWTSSNQNKGYMSITAHFIDDNWQLQSRLVRFIYVPAHHNAEEVFKRLKQRESQYKCLPSDEDWTMASEIVCQIKSTLQEWFSSPRDTIRNMATTMLAKFDKYWSTINGVMAVGAILDPRVKQLCADLVAEYQSKEKKSVMTLSDSATFTLTDVSSLPKQTKWDSGYFRFVKESACSVTVNSTVALESAFSTGGRVLSPHRSRLNPNTVEALMCSQDWLRIELLACLNSTNARMFTEDTDPTDEASCV
ncbi:zinc finger BED domain-containing protein RICESLEEPER 2-like [Senna tora]|uniref:Zinc finger BED domain-containing protein RICESLEEPER 2-like n=1 Tax=Senna tora TaxID=362788 RepID=A0A834SZM3_9FABA|nr:zinc finger BED domain-containing protein RICESLEEPER 2-like [Senna tora]